jgi:hypothetical protein
MVLGALLRTIFGALIGLILGVILSLFPSFCNAITEGINTITGVDLTGQIIPLMTGLGFLLGLLSGIIHIMSKGH